MKRFTILALLIGLTACAQKGDPNTAPLDMHVTPQIKPYVKVSPGQIRLENVTVFTGDGTEPLRNYSIRLDGRHISAVAPAGTLPTKPGETILSLDNHSVMPGIVGLHNHTHMPGVPLMAYTAPRLYLAGGVTTMTTAGSANTLGELALAKHIAAGESPGPTLYSSAPYITGPSGNAVMNKPATEEDARKFVHKWADEGVHWFKLYRHTEPHIAKAIIEEAHLLGLKVTGHLCSITFTEAALLGIDSLEHGFNAATDFVDKKPKGTCVPSRQSKVGLDMEGDAVDTLIKTLVEEEVTLTSTLAILESGFAHRPQTQARALRALSPESQERYHTRQKRLRANAHKSTSTPAYWDRINAFEQKFVEAGGHLVAGPDTGRHVLPGFGDQRNLELLVESGFSVSQAIKIMTHNGAVTLGIGDQTGLIKPGFEADLLIIPGDITSNPSAIRSSTLVFKDGVGYDPQKLIRDVEGKVGLPETLESAVNPVTLATE